MPILPQRRMGKSKPASEPGIAVITIWARTARFIASGLKLGARLQKAYYRLKFDDAASFALPNRSFFLPLENLEEEIYPLSRRKRKNKEIINQSNLIDSGWALIPTRLLPFKN